MTRRDRGLGTGDKVEVLTLEDVQGAVTELARVRARIKQSEAITEQKIAQAKADLQAATASEREQEAVYLAVLEDWAKGARKEWAPAKSLKLAGGRIGFRDHPPALKTVGKGGWEAAVERVKRVLGAAFIRTKEEVDRDAVKTAKFDKEKLRTAGLKLAEGVEEFYVETEEVTV